MLQALVPMYSSLQQKVFLRNSGIMWPWLEEQRDLVSPSSACVQGQDKSLADTHLCRSCQA